MVHFVGAGPGAPDLITVRGQRLLREADVILYAGSLVNPALLAEKKEGCRIYNSAEMTLEQVLDVMRRAHEDGLDVVRLHTGDPSLYGAVREQMDALEAGGIPYDSTPGVSSLCGAAAALDLEYTLPGISQSVILTRMEGRTPMPEKETIEAFAAHGVTMVVFLSAGMPEALSARLLAGGYAPDTPAAIVYKATWPEEEKYLCTVETLAQTAAAHGITKTALIIVGDAVAQAGYERSRLYDPAFATGFRGGTESQPGKTAETDAFADDAERSAKTDAFADDAERSAETDAFADGAGKTAGPAGGYDGTEQSPHAAGTLTVVGIGPGAAEQMTLAALQAIEESDVLVGYRLYVNLLRDRFPGKKVLATPMRREEERCALALQEAAAGARVAFVCSGDAGVYGLAGLLSEMAQDYPAVEVRVIPGVTAALSGAALLGAPLIHDFVLISLSDLLTPWETIEKRLRMAAEGDFVIVLYNPSSKKRSDYLQRACDILLQTLSPDRVCGTVRNIGREGEEMHLYTLGRLRDVQVDMVTTVFIGNSSTRRIGDRMVTPRGYARER